MRGSRPSWIASLVSENAPEITACDAITDASVDSAIAGSSQNDGNRR